MVWQAWIKVPYVGMIHDFAVTQKHIVFYVIAARLRRKADRERRHPLVLEESAKRPTSA